MAEQAVLEVEIRSEKGKSAARRLRRAGKIPAVLYGKGVEEKDLQIDAQRLQRFLQTGTGGLVELKFGGTSQVVLVKDVQSEPIMGTPLHVDFHVVELDKEVLVTVPLQLTGEEERVNDGGIVSQSLREVAVHCLPTAIPESVSIDISGLTIGESLTAGAIELPQGVRIAVDEGENVVSILAPKTEPEPEAASGEEAGAEAPAGGGEEATEASAQAEE